MRSLIGRAIRADGYEQRATAGPNGLAQWGSTAPPPPGQGGLSAGGTIINDQSALQLGAVWGSVSLISDSVATLPVRQWKRAPGAEPVAMEPAPVIEQPTPEMERRDFITQGTLSYLLRGNVFGQITARDTPLLYPSQVKLVHPDHARVRRTQAGTIEVYYRNKKVTPPDNVTRGMALSVPEGLVGLNPIEYLRNVMGLARAQDLWANSFFANSARPDGVISVKGDLDPVEAKAMRDDWLAAHQGINHAHLPAVLQNDATWTPITMSLADVQFLEQMQFSAQVISGMIYRVPPHMIGIVDKDTSWGSGIEQQELGFVRNTLLIWLCRWEDLMSSWLPPGQFVTFDLSHRLRGDTLQRWTAWQIARVIGAMSNAEIRKVEGLPVVDDPSLQAFDQPLNSAPVKPGQPGVGGDKAN